MAKEVSNILKLQIPAGQANPAPPVGPALGQVGVNIHAAVSPETPFGGNKQSGWGREFGKEGLDPYLKTKAISIKI